MNYLKCGAICVLLSLCYISSHAQNTAPVTEPAYNKPRLFADISEKLIINVSELDFLFSLPVGQTISTQLNQSFLFNGTIVSKSAPAETNFQSVIIKSTNRLGATFGFSKIRNSDSSFVYRGRIISYGHSDAFDVVREAGEYVLIKKHSLKILNE